MDNSTKLSNQWELSLLKEAIECGILNSDSVLDIIMSSKKPANKSQVLFSRFLKLFVNLFLCTIRRPALYPAYTKS